MAKMYFKTGITGGDDSTSGDLDGIDGAVLADGDSAIVVDASNGLTYFYALDVDSGAAESVPEVIKPDINAENKRWLLQDVYQNIKWSDTKISTSYKIVFVSGIPMREEV